MSAQDLPKPLVAAFGEKVQVDLAEGGQEPVGVGDGVHVMPVRSGVGDLESVVHQVRERQCDREKSGLDVLEGIALTAHHGYDLDRMGSVRADDRVVVVFVRTQNRMRIVVFAGKQTVEVGCVRPQIRACALVGLRHLVTPYAVG